MAFFNRTVLKYFLGVVGLALVGIAVNYAVAVYQYMHSAEYLAGKDMQGREQKQVDTISR